MEHIAQQVFLAIAAIALIRYIWIWHWTKKVEKGLIEYFNFEKEDAEKTARRAARIYFPVEANYAVVELGEDNQDRKREYAEE